MRTRGLFEAVVVAVHRPSRRALADVLVAGLLMVVDLLASFDPMFPGGVTADAAVLYALPAYALLVWRRRFPGPVFVVVLAHSLLAWVFVPGYLPTLSVWAALYTLAVLCELRWALLALLVAAGPAVLNVMDEVQRRDPGDRLNALVVSTTLLAVVNVGVFGVGRWVRWSLEQRRIVAEHAAADAVRAERGRIARDLHDVVAHSITLMVLQAAGAARLLRADPGRAEAALGHVDDLGQQAIVELRRMLGLLATGTAAQELEPRSSPGTRDIPTLVERARAGDLLVDFLSTGVCPPLDAGVDLSVYRIVQEALTNAARYADRSQPVELRLKGEDGHVDVLVANHIGHRRSVSSSHRGLLGMRERALATGGTLTAGVEPDGRFVVRARLPVTRQPAATGAVGVGVPAGGGPHAG